MWEGAVLILDTCRKEQLFLILNEVADKSQNKKTISSMKCCSMVYFRLKEMFGGGNLVPWFTSGLKICLEVEILFLGLLPVKIYVWRWKSCSMVYFRLKDMFGGGNLVPFYFRLKDWFGGGNCIPFFTSG